MTDVATALRVLALWLDLDPRFYNADGVGILLERIGLLDPVRSSGWRRVRTRGRPLENKRFCELLGKARIHVRPPPRRSCRFSVAVCRGSAIMAGMETLQATTADDGNRCADGIRWREAAAAEWDQKAAAFDSRAAYWRSLNDEKSVAAWERFAAKARGNAAVLRTEVRALLVPALVAEMASAS